MRPDENMEVPKPRCQHVLSRVMACMHTLIFFVWPQMSGWPHSRRPACGTRAHSTTWCVLSTMVFALGDGGRGESRTHAPPALDAQLPPHLPTNRCGAACRPPFPTAPSRAMTASSPWASCLPPCSLQDMCSSCRCAEQRVMGHSCARRSPRTVLLFERCLHTPASQHLAAS